MSQLLHKSGHFDSDMHTTVLQCPDGHSNKLAKRHENDYHGVVVHTLGDHSPLKDIIF